MFKYKVTKECDTINSEKYKVKLSYENEVEIEIPKYEAFINLKECAIKDAKEFLDNKLKSTLGIDNELKSYLYELRGNLSLYERNRIITKIEGKLFKKETDEIK